MKIYFDSIYMGTVVLVWEIGNRGDHTSVCANMYEFVNLLNSTGHVMHQQFNIQQLYVLPTL